MVVLAAISLAWGTVYLLATRTLRSQVAQTPSVA